MTRIERWKTELRSRNVINMKAFIKDDSRIIRQAISELGSEGIIFVTNHKKVYTRVELTEMEDIVRFLTETTNHLRTTYRNKIKPIKGYIQR